MPTLDWIGKSKVVNHHLDVPYCVLERKYSYDENGQHEDDNGSENMIIHGDNLIALKSLLPQYEGRIKCIYIDPPYNTGNENWVYNDNVNDPRIRKWLGEVVGSEGADLTRHDKWLCMMYPRLKLLERLLSEDGTIFISLDDNEVYFAKLICDEIFGTTSFISNIIWENFYGRSNAGAISPAHNYTLVYSKAGQDWKNIRHLLPRSEESNNKYKNPDNDPRGLWRTGPIFASGERHEGLMYTIKTPSGRIVSPPKGSHWRMLEDDFWKMVADNRIIFGEAGNNVPAIKLFLKEVQGGMVPKSIWSYKDAGHTQEAKRELQDIFPEMIPFDTPKPTKLLNLIINIASDPDSIILDSFAGSGTTAHAVLNMNKQDGGNRKCILIEMENYADDITAERIKRVINGYGEGKKKVAGTGGNFGFYELGEPIFSGDNLNENIGEDEIRKYVYFTETKQSITYRNDDEKFYMGTHMDVAYYFNYEKNSITILNRDFLHTIKTKAEAYVIYADLCTLSERELNKWNITFKKIPRDISKL